MSLEPNDEPAIDKTVKQVLDLNVARVVHKEGLNFNIFDKAAHPEMHALFTSSLGEYEPPSRERLRGDLLDLVYDDTEQQIIGLLSEQSCLNFSIDESTDMAKRRIANLSVNLPRIGSFCLQMYDLGSERATAENLSDWVKSGLLRWTCNDLRKVNQISIDTYPTIRLLHSLIEKDPKYEHVFFVLYNSYSL